jgi:dihydropyrimidinase
MPRLLVHDARLVYADGSTIAGGLICEDGRIAQVFEGAPPSGHGADEEIDADGRPLLPGLIDPHVQLYPLPDWAQYETEGGSAALGGVTTIIKMHRDLHGFTQETVDEEIAGAERRGYVDFAFHLALMSDAQVASVAEYAEAFRLSSFKLFMAYKGAEGEPIGVQGLDDGALLDAFRAIAAAGGVALVHCENQELAARALRNLGEQPGNDLAAFEASRPWLAEAEAIGRAIELAGVAGCPLYVVHVTSRQGLDVIARAKAAGHAVHAETEPHYLTETVDSPAGLLAKVMPPIRRAEDNERLWRGIEEGLVETIGSDHVMAVRERKQGSLWNAQLGFAGVGSILPVLLSAGVHGRGLDLSRIAAITSTNAARIFGLERKGALLPGRDADFVVVDLERERTVSAEILGSRSDFSIYEGRRLRGWPALTVRRGEVLARDGELVASPGGGRYIARTPRRAPIRPMEIA